jgi:hypothetical protein
MYEYVSEKEEKGLEKIQSISTPGRYSSNISLFPLKTRDKI